MTDTHNTTYKNHGIIIRIMKDAFGEWEYSTKIDEREFTPYTLRNFSTKGAASKAALQYCHYRIDNPFPHRIDSDAKGA
jgi:hypothetical protein